MIDTTHGTVAVFSAGDKPEAMQAGDFTASLFRLLQARGQHGLTQLQLQGGLARAKVCGRAGRARVTARHPLSKQVLRLLRATVSGRFSARGDYSSTTVRGTQWATIDRCDGTLTSDTRGTVIVRDFRRHKTVVVKAGKSYLARAR